MINIYLPAEIPIQDRITAGAEHGEEVEGEEGDIVVGPTEERNLNTRNHVST